MKLPNQIKNGVKTIKIELDDFKNNDKKKKQTKKVSFWGNYQMKYQTKFDLYIDSILIVFMFCVKIFFLNVDVRK